MPNPVVGMIGATVGSAVIQGASGRSAAKSQERAANAGIAEQRAARESFEARTQPFADIGLAAGVPILELLGISVPQSLMPKQATPQEIQSIDNQISSLESQLATMPKPTGRDAIYVGPKQRAINDVISQIDALRAQKASMPEAQLPYATEGVPQTEGVIPGQMPQPRTAIPNPETSPGSAPTTLFDFLQKRGQSQLEESAAAQGRLRSGGTLEELSQFNAGLAAQEEQRRFNNLFNLLGLGANAATGQGSAALSTASNIGDLLSNRGAAQAYGAQAVGNSAQQGISGLAGIYGLQQGGFFNTPPPSSGLLSGASSIGSGIFGMGGG